MIIFAIIGRLVMFCMFGSAGILFIWCSLQMLWRGARSKKWPEIQAEATDFLVRSLSDGTWDYYCYTIFYGYTVGGDIYLARGDDSCHFSSYADAEAAAMKESSLRKSLTVFYYPKKPKIYVLQRGIDTSVFCSSVYGVLCLVLASSVLPWLIGLFVIGMPPAISCPTPDFSERRWIPSECPNI
ncbi:MULTISPECIES: DUF3592 domain-containing protein [Leptolyngbya]|uniref:DUF3592 domain-containing protein n=1 Tax=Leptolyngbya TaxID=47251 RepID=UPI001682867B|nr:DUF3592 domain-containing protein [Leptolyngbya sp. FACHB-1624]MBD1859522.1 DUF3592 domain-containing protein [Leptolyngbya sp. FACHB-1624]